MKKSSFVALVLGVVSGMLFSLGMCMCLLPEWDAFAQGVGLGAVGAVLALVTVFVWRRMEHKPPIKLSGWAVLVTTVVVIGALLLGVGLCLCMVWDKMALGVIVGMIGILALLALIPMLKGLHD